MKNNITVIDKAAWALSGTLMLLGIVVLGIVEILAGKPYNAAPLMNDAGEVIASPAVDPVFRTGLVVLGILVLLLWGLYRMVQPTIEAGTESPDITQAD
jgi:hypothetical protein